MAAKEFETWAQQLLDHRRDRLPAAYVEGCEEYFAQGDHRLVAFVIVRDSFERDDVPSLTTGELKQARIYNDRGAFPRQASPYFRELFTQADRLVAA